MTIQSVFENFGSSFFIKGRDGWKSPVFNAFLQPIKYKNKMYLEGFHTPIGVEPNDIYVYLGPANHDLTKLDSSYKLVDSFNTTYKIDRAEKIVFQNKSLYIWAVVRKVSGT